MILTLPNGHDFLWQGEKCHWPNWGFLKRGTNRLYIYHLFFLSVHKFIMVISWALLECQENLQNFQDPFPSGYESQSPKAREPYTPMLKPEKHRGKSTRRAKEKSRDEKGKQGKQLEERGREGKKKRRGEGRCGKVYLLIFEVLSGLVDTHPTLVKKYYHRKTLTMFSWLPKHHSTQPGWHTPDVTLER